MIWNIYENYFWEILVTTVALTFLTCYLFLTSTFDYWKKQGVPGNKPRPILGTIKSLGNGTLQDQDFANHKKFGRVYGGFEGRVPILHISDPEMIKQAFFKDASIFSDRKNIKTFEVTKTIRKALTFSKGDKWKKSRAILTPAFSSGKLKQMIPLIEECLHTFTQSLEKYAINKELINANDIFSSLTLDIIASCAFAIKTDSIENPNNDFKTNTEKLLVEQGQHAGLFIVSPQLFIIYSWFVQPFRKDPFKFFKQTAGNLIDERKNNKLPRRKDFLDLLLQAEITESEDGTSDQKKVLTREMMIAQCIEFLLAGHETTATTLTMIAYCLALNPAVQERLITEMDDAVVENNNIIDYDKINELQYLDMVISETLRLYSPIVRIERTCSENNYNLEGVNLNKDVVVSVSTYNLHHDQQFYPDPEKFDPERFSPENRKDRNPYTYLPFGTGPRMCIANTFAFIEIKLAIAHILRNYRFLACPQTQVPLSFIGNRFNLLSPNEVILFVQKRSQN